MSVVSHIVFLGLLASKFQTHQEQYDECEEAQEDRHYNNLPIRIIPTLGGDFAVVAWTSFDGNAASLVFTAVFSAHHGMGIFSICLFNYYLFSY